MRSLMLFAFSGILAALAAGSAVQAQEADTRIASMPYADCLSIIAEVSGDIDEKPVHLVDTDDLTTVRINASDGFVTVSCSRSDNRMVLTKSPVPDAAGLTASR